MVGAEVALSLLGWIAMQFSTGERVRGLEHG